MSNLARILIVDDDETIRSATQRVLQPAGYEILCAADGEEAIQMTRIHRPDLILMDMNMPRMDGIEAMRRIKADADVAATFIVIISGSRVDTESQAHGLEIGADGYITRPISTRELLARIQAMLRIKAAEDAVRQLNSELERRVAERTRELQQAQEKLVRQERLAVLGQLAGSVGHELRNPLAVIANATHFLKIIQPADTPQSREYLGIIEKEVYKAEKILADLLDFARVQASDRQVISLAQVAADVLDHYPTPANITATVNVPQNLPPAFADPLHIEQVLRNLLINACQAMPAGGELTISAMQQADEIAVAVQDSGMGIPAENMGKLFEPLFTTKPAGIGLGLAVSKKLIEANGGRIEVQSEPGKGSTFTFWLPVKR
jgi:signal transduction histidine kinase